MIIAGGGIHYSDAHAALERLAGQVGIPVVETFGGKGAVTKDEWWQVGGVGLEGNFASNVLVKQADLVLSVGTRLTDFATGSQSIFENDNVKFAALNIVDADTRKQGATGILADARLGLEALAQALEGHSTADAWQDTVQTEKARWAPIRTQWLDADTPYNPEDHPHAPVTEAVLTQPQLIGLMQEHARSGDTVIAAAGGPPGDLQKVWDATGNRNCHLEFGFSCMGYEIAAGMGVRLAEGNNDNRVVTFIGDGTFLMAPTEILTAAQEGLNVTVIVSENHGYQVIHRLQMNRSRQEFGNEFRYRTTGGSVAAADAPKARLDGDYLKVDLRQIAEGLGALAIRATTAAEVREALSSTRGHPGPGRHRGPHGAARGPARRRRLVGRCPGGSFRPGMGPTPSAPNTSRRAAVSGGSDEPRIAECRTAGCRAAASASFRRRSHGRDLRGNVIGHCGRGLCSGRRRLGADRS